MRVFSVPVSVPFLRTVIAALVDGALVDGFEARANPLNLARATLYLPTRRAGRRALRRTRSAWTLPDLVLRSSAKRCVSKDEWHQRGLMVRDGARAPPHHEGLAVSSGGNRPRP